jgi:hypothetical protein
LKTLQDVYDYFMAENAKKQRGIMLALPMYGGMCTGDFALSLSKVTLMLHDLGFKYHIETLYNESLIPRGRNILAQSFLERDNMDYLMFIDADIGFLEVDLLKLLLADRELSGGAYPKKRINWQVVEKAVKAGKEGDDLANYTGDFAFNLVSQDGAPDELGMIEVKHIATGFMLIKKSVLESLKPHVPKYTELKNDGSIYEAYDFFQIGPNPDTGRYTSEDYFFCNLWRKHGGQIYLNPFIKLTHTGTYIFSGDLKKLGTEKL